MKTIKAHTLDKNITRFVKKFGVKKASIGDTFFYLNGKISYSVYAYDDDEQHIQFINDTYGIDVRPFYFLFSILHEVGHHMTVPDLTEEDLAFEIFARDAVLPLVENEDTNDLYFRLPAEDMANRWALEYILNHTEECWKFQRKCYAIMRHLFKKRKMI